MQRGTHIGIELANEAREVVVLEVSGKQSQGEGVRIPNNKAIVSPAPRDNPVSGGIINNIEGLGEEWRRPKLMKTIHGARKEARRRGGGGGHEAISRELLLDEIGETVHGLNQRWKSLKKNNH